MRGVVGEHGHADHLSAIVDGGAVGAGSELRVAGAAEIGENHRRAVAFPQPGTGNDRKHGEHDAAE